MLHICGCETSVIWHFFLFVFKRPVVFQGISASPQVDRYNEFYRYNDKYDKLLIQLMNIYSWNLMKLDMCKDSERVIERRKVRGKSRISFRRNGHSDWNCNIVLAIGRCKDTPSVRGLTHRSDGLPQIHLRSTCFRVHARLHWLLIY